MFTASDLYLASGTGTVFNAWIPYVTKHDTSSFYNWEQDNLPLYDLEDRTNLLWEKLGFPIANGFSGIPGIMFAVSADAPFAGESSGIIFKSVSSVINILPEVITLPIIIEVANFGSLGELNLNNLKFKDNGGLEIINRNFSKLYANPTNTNQYTAYVANATVSSTDGWGTLRNASCISISSRISSALATDFTSVEARYEGKNILYVNRVPGINTGSPGGTGSSLFSLHWDTAVDSGDNFMQTDSSAFSIKTSIGYDSTKDLTISSYDFIPYNALLGSYDGTSVRRRTTAASFNTRWSGYVYGNWFTKVKIKNCNGPIYIRNFAVDGGTGYAGTLMHNTDNGFEIDNSRIVLENALACRCKEVGFRISNSDITIMRGIVGIRNYTLTDFQTRSPYKSAGLRAINSNINLSASPYVSGGDFQIQFTKNAIGMELFNSRWRGGQSRSEVLQTSALTYLQAFYNTDTGIKVNGSYLEVPGRIDVYDNGNIGLAATNSEIVFNELTAEYNLNYGIFADNSHLRYNQDLYKYTKLDANDPDGQVNLRNNGVNIQLEKSDLLYTEGNSLPDKYGQFYVSGSLGVSLDSNGNKTSLPNIQLFNGSNFKTIHNRIANNQNIQVTTPIYGILLSLRNNSKATLIGTKECINTLIGPNNYSDQPHVAAIAADNASIIELQGPTVIVDAGIDLLAENNSIINLSPPRDVHGNLLVSSFNLSDPDNHTKVELHSTRACIVVNKNSILNAQDLGSYNVIWPTAQASAGDYNYLNSNSTASLVSGGYLQFYPNGQDADIISTSSGRYNAADYNPGLFASPTVPAHNYLLLDPTAATSNADILAYSTGGMCVRVMNGSIANVKNVNFPCGWDNTSGILYDASGGNCDLLRIWNIGSDSELEASYFSVSGLYPSLAGYYGPSAVYSTSAGVLSGAPVWVPDTGILSVLDHYGASGSNVGTNYGPFRIYVSVDGPAKFLNYYNGSGLIYNSAYQTWSQGYNPSGSVSAAPQVSGYYKNLTTSTFLTTSSMIDPGYRSRIRLDQSAADSFSNAKNGALARSGRVPFCTIYRSSIDEGGEGFDTTAPGHGIGLLSVNIFDLSRDN
jgi:hypothetical protein